MRSSAMGIDLINSLLSRREELLLSPISNALVVFHICARESEECPETLDRRSIREGTEGENKLRTTINLFIPTSMVALK